MSMGYSFPPPKGRANRFEGATSQRRCSATLRGHPSGIGCSAKNGLVIGLRLCRHLQHLSIDTPLSVMYTGWYDLMKSTARTPRQLDVRRSQRVQRKAAVQSA